MASIGLTIPASAVASIWLGRPLELGLGARQVVLLAITVVVAGFTVLPGRATVQEGGVHLAVLAAFVFRDQPLRFLPTRARARHERPVDRRAPLRKSDAAMPLPGEPTRDSCQSRRSASPS